MKSKARIHFEQNMLDGDDVNNCGGAMLSAKSVLEYIEENMYPLAQQEILDRVMEVKPKRKVFVPNIGFAGLTMLEAGFNNAVDEFDEKLSTLKDTNI